MTHYPMIVKFEAKTGELVWNDLMVVLVFPDFIDDSWSFDDRQNALRERAVDVFIGNFKHIFSESELISATASHILFDVIPVSSDYPVPAE